MFLDDLKERTDEANDKREKYENELKWINMAEIITGGIAGFFFSLNMLGYVSISCKNLSVDSRVIALLFTFLIGKKLIQNVNGFFRGKTRENGTQRYYRCVMFLIIGTVGKRY